MIETLLSGGVTGLIGTVFSSWNARKLKELEMSDRDKQRSHDVAIIKAESEAMIAESKAQIQIEGERIAGEIELAETAAFTETIKANQEQVFNESYMEKLFSATGWIRYLSIPAGILLAVFSGLVDFVKGMARPGITIYLLSVSTWITVKAWNLLDSLDASLTPVMAMAIVSDAVNIVLYLTVTAVTWWFGDRMATKGLAKNLKLRSF